MLFSGPAPEAPAKFYPNLHVRKPGTLKRRRRYTARGWNIYAFSSLLKAILRDSRHDYVWLRMDRLKRAGYSESTIRRNIEFIRQHPAYFGLIFFTQGHYTTRRERSNEHNRFQWRIIVTRTAFFKNSSPHLFRQDKKPLHTRCRRDFFSLDADDLKRIRARLTVSKSDSTSTGSLYKQNRAAIIEPGKARIERLNTPGSPSGPPSENTTPTTRLRALLARLAASEQQSTALKKEAQNRKQIELPGNFSWKVTATFPEEKTTKRKEINEP